MHEGKRTHHTILRRRELQKSQRGNRPEEEKRERTKAQNHHCTDIFVAESLRNGKEETPRFRKTAAQQSDMRNAPRLEAESMSMSEDPVRVSEGKATKITKINPVGVGCVNLASRYDTDVGSFFVKTNSYGRWEIGPSVFGFVVRSIGPSMFEAEALGLGAMYETGTICVPKPYKFGLLPTGGSFIIMEFIQFGASRGYQGGSLLKCIKLESPVKPMVSMLITPLAGQRPVKSMGRLFANVVIEPCLLHGDLWSGNISSNRNGEPVILDPACYYGHSEAEFGMSWCAGFEGSVYDSYFKVMPKQPGFEERRDLYMLYHCLNHYNLFGSGYRSSAMSIIDDYLDSVVSCY
ncbi:hypothetical protein VNO80_06969 [Phaseolus coccineus]|uniref:protein-ribulosamine 3-kinase n=1 Tax=Phaseolus coccineus TaxID=3886 RepID=A0AAN9NJ95_PHACN